MGRPGEGTLYLRRQYIIALTDLTGASPDASALLLAAGLSIDIVYKEKKSDLTGRKVEFSNGAQVRASFRRRPPGRTQTTTRAVWGGPWVTSTSLLQLCRCNQRSTATVIS
jgi:hypothetical protein